MLTYRSALAVVLLAAACASGGSGSDGSGGATTRASRDVITRAEVEQSDVTNAYDLIRRLRPEFLRPRGGGGRVIFYLDNVRLQGAEQLESVSREEVEEIRYLSSTDASMRFGLDHTSGAVIVRTRR